ncbi:dCTP deaminase [Wohlfahrtiimonas chitiniclastica]|uniref:dCTP deaminase n=1 Tax=Wohlfahrtiimonas chitiniclastica TaxID=400946 RepID=UPI000B98F4E2|nr:dCTP deaminase [Wohlfahrtiimonas chitiniclastica]OYQ77503.1 dCTP deaminase [Wohlfahrtiimonas chitiniclastica]
MILTGNKINNEVEQGKIVIDPFNETQLSTNSYDIRLGKKYIKYQEEVIDPKKANKYNLCDIPEEGLHMKSGDFILSESKEIIGSKYYVPILHAKSGTARSGLFVHVTADLIDIGSIGNITFQLFATLPIIIYPNMLIGQISFWVPDGEIELYNGKYQHSSGPQPSRTFLDYNKN